MGFGACAAILIPLEEENEAVVRSKEVGIVTDNVECEVVGIELALEAIDQYTNMPDFSIEHCKVFMLLLWAPSQTIPMDKNDCLQHYGEAVLLA